MGNIARRKGNRETTKARVQKILWRRERKNKKTVKRIKRNRLSC